MTATRGELTDAERVARLEEEVQHLAAECDRLQQELDRAESRRHDVAWGRLRTLDEWRGYVPRIR